MSPRSLASSASICQLDRLIVERDREVRIGHEDFRVAAQRLRPLDVVQVAVHVAVEVGLLRDEERHLAELVGIADRAGDDAALADAGLVADDESIAVA